MLVLLGIGELSSVVLCQQLCTTGNVGLIHHLLKSAGFSMRESTFALPTSPQMSVFDRTDLDLSCRVPGLLVQDSVL